MTAVGDARGRLARLLRVLPPANGWWMPEHPETLAPCHGSRSLPLRPVSSIAGADPSGNGSRSAGDAGWVGNGRCRRPRPPGSRCLPLCVLPQPREAFGAFHAAADVADWYAVLAEARIGVGPLRGSGPVETHPRGGPDLTRLAGVIARAIRLPPVPHASRRTPS